METGHPTARKGMTTGNKYLSAPTVVRIRRVLSPESPATVPNKAISEFIRPSDEEIAQKLLLAELRLAARQAFPDTACLEDMIEEVYHCSRRIVSWYRREDRLRPRDVGRVKFFEESAQFHETLKACPFLPQAQRVLLLRLANVLYYAVQDCVYDLRALAHYQPEDAQQESWEGVVKAFHTMVTTLVDEAREVIPGLTLARAFEATLAKIGTRSYLATKCEEAESVLADHLLRRWQEEDMKEEQA